MREIKFRGKRDDMSDYSWKYGSLIKEGDKYFIRTPDMKGGNGLGNEVFPETVGQYTGLKDKNGKEIYEGDVVTHEYLGTGEVKWDEIITGFYSYVDASDEGCLYLSNPDTGKVEVEIIGNIHENKT